MDHGLAGRFSVLCYNEGTMESVRGEGDGSAPRRRRTQRERSAETKTKLLEVTISCLAELGYGGTTSQIVAERAGLTRGAQLHHFGSKAELVTHAMQRLFDQRLEEFRAGLADIPADGEYTAAVLDLVWRLVAGSAGYAYLELVIAARTDPELLASMRQLTARMDAQVETTFNEVFGASEGMGDVFDLAWTAVFSLMEGLALERIVRQDDRRIDGVLAMLKQFAPMLLQHK